jgi:hypothetical protein
MKKRLTPAHVHEMAKGGGGLSVPVVSYLFFYTSLFEVRQSLTHVTLLIISRNCYVDYHHLHHHLPTSPPLPTSGTYWELSFSFFPFFTILYINTIKWLARSPRSVSFIPLDLLFLIVAVAIVYVANCT